MTPLPVEPLSTNTSQVARLQQLLVMGVLLGALVWLGYWLAEPATAWGGVGALAGVAAGVLALQFGASVAVSRRRGQPVAWQPALAVAWWREVVVACQVFVWRQPWRWAAWPDRLPSGLSSADLSGQRAQANPRGVLLVHGFMCNRGLWNGWLAELARRDVPVVAVNLEPFLGSIDDYVPIIERAVSALTASSGRPPLVVAHSMGGLAMRAWLRATPDGAQRVAHVVTVGTPHQGTWLARWALATNARQMQLNSPWLSALAAQEPADLGQLFTCWHSCADNIVYPLGTAVLPGSTVRYLPHVGHVALVDHPQVLADTLARLD
ncbi:MAG: alpha/beta fold hydrolase [Burkholderiales bacterium]|nr:alpha/beta fold hydrolase [Burkholderiales bacterium]